MKRRNNIFLLVAGIVFGFSLSATAQTVISSDSAVPAGDRVNKAVGEQNRIAEPFHPDSLRTSFSRKDTILLFDTSTAGSGYLYGGESEDIPVLPIVIGMDTLTSGETAAVGPSYPEVTLMDDEPFAAMLDNLLLMHYIEDSRFSADSVALNVFGFPSGYVPRYDSAIYSAHLALLDEQTPFSLVYNVVVQRFIDLYTVDRREQVSRMLGLAELYFPMFEEVIDRYGLPLELKYLAVIESALNPNAVSSSGAVGLWQFMYRTGKLFNLDVTSYIDERKSPLKSTEAACKYLKFLYELYGNWDLALAAYNCGPGTVNRAIRRSKGVTDFWKLWPYLPPETRVYVPAFIAANYVFNYTAEHNLYPVIPRFFHYQTDTVHIYGELPFDKIVHALDISMEDLRYLNPVFRRDIIPASTGCFHVLTLPAEKIGDFLTNQQLIFELKPLQPDSSDTLKPEAPAKKPETEMVSTKRVSEKKPAQATSKSPARERSNRFIYYVIQPGDTLWDIARKYDGVTVQQIKKLNNIRDAKNLKPGRKIKIAISG